MLSHNKLKNISLVLALAGGLSLGRVAQAQTQHINVNTSALNGLGTYYVDYTLADGSGKANGNSKAVISNFQVTGGTLGTVLPPTTGDVIGALSSGSTLTFVDDGTSRNGSSMNTSGTADFAQAFTISSASSFVSFDVTLSATGLDTTPGPDSFQLQLLDSSTAPLATTGPTGTEILSAAFTTSNPVPIGYSSTDSLYTPAVTASVTPAPEPSGFVAIGLGTAGMLVLRWRTRRQRHLV